MGVHQGHEHGVPGLQEGEGPPQYGRLPQHTEVSARCGCRERPSGSCRIVAGQADGVGCALCATMPVGYSPSWLDVLGKGSFDQLLAESVQRVHGYYKVLMSK